MKTFLLLIYSTAIYFSTTAQTPNILWQQSYGGSLYDKGSSIIETQDGGFVVAGHSQSSNNDLSFNNGGSDWWILKLDNIGNITWKKTLGGSGDDLIHQVIAVENGNFLCIGETFSTNGDVTGYINPIDFWVIKLNASGDVLWKKCYGGDNLDWGYSACLTTDGNYIIAGSTQSGYPEVIGNHGDADFWVLKIDTSGGILWQKTYGGTNRDYLKHIIKTSDGSYILTGDSYSANGDVGMNYGGQDVWLVKINSAGQLEWQNTFGGTADDFATKVMEDEAGNFLVVGETYSTDLDATENHSNAGMRDYFIIKTNNLGQKIWARCYGGTSEEYARKAIQTSSNEYVITGESYSNDGQAPNNKGSADFWLIKIKPSDGNLIWQKTYGSGGHDEPTDLIMTFDNNFVVLGHSYSTEDLGDLTQRFGDDDIWVVKLSNTECIKTLTLKQDILFGNQDFKATENIIGSAKILDSYSNIKYTAGNSITLKSGFSTQLGAVFEAKIANCN